MGGPWGGGERGNPESLSRCTAGRDYRGENFGGLPAQGLVDDDVLDIAWTRNVDPFGKFAAQLGRELPFWSDAFDRVSSERGAKRTTEWQDDSKCSVTICFSNRTDSLQSRVRRFDSDPRLQTPLSNAIVPGVFPAFS